MRIGNIFLLFILIPFYSFGQFSEKKVYNIKEIQNPPKIDGKLNDMVWEDIIAADSFSQISPNNGVPERKDQTTRVKICYDSKNIYFGVMMYDNAPDSILKELTKRDNLGNTDVFSIYINPFNDGQIEYFLAVTASGIQNDAKHTTSLKDDSWNAQTLASSGVADSRGRMGFVYKSQYRQR